jgi:dystrophin
LFTVNFNPTKIFALKKIYKTLSEIKSEVEAVLKQGRGIVDKQQVDNTQELTSQLDNLKLKYNDLGSRVTNVKNDIERAYKCSKKFRKEYNLIGDFLSKIDNELKKIELKPLSKNFGDELDWIKNTRYEINKVEANVDNLKGLYKALSEMAKDHQLTCALNKVKDIEDKLTLITKRLDIRSNFIQVRESGHAFFQLCA